MKLYHGTNNENLEFQSEYLYSSLRNGLFFTDSLDTAESFGKYIYVTEFSENELLTQDDIASNDNEEIILSFLKNKAEEYDLNVKSDDDLYTLYDLVVLHGNDISNYELTQYLFNNNEEYDLVSNKSAEDLWQVQNLRLELAIKLGYKAAEMYDETGTSYFVTNPTIKKI